MEETSSSNEESLDNENIIGENKEEILEPIEVFKENTFEIL